MKENIHRFIKFIEEDIANDEYYWEYEDGDPMTQDAKDFMKEFNKMKGIIDSLPWDYESKF